MHIGDCHCPQWFDWLGNAIAQGAGTLSATRTDCHLAAFIELNGPHWDQWSLALALCLLAGALMGMQGATGVAEVDLLAFLVQALSRQFIIGIELGGETIGEQDTIATRLVSHLPDGVVSFKITPVELTVCQCEVAVVTLQVVLSAVLAHEQRGTGRRLDGLFL